MQTYRFGCWHLSNWLATSFSFIFARQYHATHAVHRLRNARVAFQQRVSSPLRGKAIWDRRRGGTGLWIGLAGRTSRRSRQPPPGTNADGHWLLLCPSRSYSRSLTLPPLHMCFFAFPHAPSHPLRHQRKQTRSTWSLASHAAANVANEGSGRAEGKSAATWEQ